MTGTRSGYVGHSLKRKGFGLDGTGGAAYPFGPSESGRDECGGLKGGSTSVHESIESELRHARLERRASD